MSKKVARIIAMLELIPKLPRKISVSQLHSHLTGMGYSVTERSIQRDLHTMSEDFPLITDSRSKPYGWSRDNHTAQGIPSLNPYEALTFVIAYEQFSNRLPKSLTEYLKPKILEAKFELNRHKESEFKSWPDKITYAGRGFQLQVAEIDPVTMDLVYEAVLKEKQLSISHKGKDDVCINPLGIVLREQVIYLICTFWGYQNPRQIAIHRIKNAKLLDEEISEIEFDLKDYCQTGAMGYLVSPSDLKIELKMTKPAARHLQETAISDDQAITVLDDNFVKVTGTVKNSKDLRWWILGFGSQLEVIKPQRLRAELKQQAEQMAASYQD